MASKPVIILHGYSDTRASFRSLARFLAAARIPVKSIFLGDYITLDDSLTIEDLAKAFETALVAEKIPTKAHGFDLIVHSTGALVAREWLTRYYLDPGRDCPVGRFLMLAPANFGSPLAHTGRSMFGRLVKGWKTRFEVGTQVLKALEQGSPYTWNLASRDLFGPRSFYREDDCLAAVFMGATPYQSGMRQLVNRKGSDGTVYVSCADLNTTGLTVNLGRKLDKPLVTPWKRSASVIPFAVFPERDHSSITRPDKGDARLGEMILRFLRLDSAAGVRDFAGDCEGLTRETLPWGSPSDEEFHSYQHVVSRVHDDLGLPVPDYFLEFFEQAITQADEKRVDELMITMHTQVLKYVHTYRDDNTYRSLLFDTTDLMRVLSSGSRLMFSLAAASPGPLIEYSAGAGNDVGELAVGPQNKQFWRPNQTLLLDLVIERCQADKVFRLHRLS